LKNIRKIQFEEFYRTRDEELFSEFSNLKIEYGLTDELVLKNYMAFVRRREFAQTVAYARLFSMVEDLPGSIIECGVYIGNGLFTWSKLLETFSPGRRGDKVFGFDSFDGYSSAEVEENYAIDYVAKIHGHGFKASQLLVEKLIELNESDNLVPGAKRIKLYSGDIEATSSVFLHEEPGTRIKLLMIDLNLFKPTRKALNSFYPILVRGAVVCFRGYGVKPWEGESKAVDEFLEGKGQSLRSFSWSPFPSAFLIKE
jgi:hypothetical protein